MYIGGQNAVNNSGEIIGKGDIEAQVRQILENLQTALAAGGAELENIIKWNVYAVQGYPIQAAFQVFQQVWGNRPPPCNYRIVCRWIGSSRFFSRDGRYCSYSRVEASTRTFQTEKMEFLLKTLAYDCALPISKKISHVNMERTTMDDKKFSNLKRPRYPMPDIVRKTLVQRDLMEAYRERPAYQQNDYIG